MDSTGESFEAICAALADRNNILTVKDLCELAGVSRSGYYNWVRSEKNREFREAKDRAAFEQILEAYRFRGYAKGVRGIHMRLLHMGIRMNVKKIRRLMRKYKLTCPIRKPNPYRRLQRSIRMGSAAENLVNREFESHGPRAILLTDITYIPLCGRFCYLSTILDACTKQVLAYAMSESLEVDFVLETVQLLVKHHGISLSKETVIHSDQGTHYTSLKFIQLVENSALRRSMSRRGNCWDNAPQESFFGHMKDELASEIPGWTSFEAAKASIDRWMDYYNNDRCQWDLAKLSPNEYYHYITTGEYPAGMLPLWSNENVLDLGSTLPESTGQGQTGIFLSGPVFSAHLLADNPADGVCGVLLHLGRGVGVGVQGKPCRIVAQRAGQRFHVYPAFQGQRGEGVAQVMEPDVFRTDSF